MDLSRLELVTENEQEKIALLALFFRVAGDCLGQMERTPADARDFKQWKNAAHSLKGSADNLGMTTLAALCQQAENAAMPDPEQRREMLARLHYELQHIRAYLADHHPGWLDEEARHASRG